MRVREMKSELRRLEAEVAEAKAKWVAAHAAATRVPETPEVGRLLTDLFGRIMFHRPGDGAAPSRVGKDLFGPLSAPTDAHVDEAIRVTRQVCERIIAGELVLAPINHRAPAAGFRLYDPALIRAVDESLAKSRAANERLAAAHAEYDAALEADERKRAVAEFRESLVSSDPERVAAAFDAVRGYERPQERRDAMSTADLTVVR